MAKKEERYVTKAERDYLASKKEAIDPKRARCQGCDLEYFAVQLARFGREKGSPLLCHVCAKAEFDKRLKRHGLTIEDLKDMNGKTEVIE